MDSVPVEASTCFIQLKKSTSLIFLLLLFILSLILSNIHYVTFEFLQEWVLTSGNASSLCSHKNLVLSQIAVARKTSTGHVLYPQNLLSLSLSISLPFYFSLFFLFFGCIHRLYLEFCFIKILTVLQSKVVVLEQEGHFGALWMRGTLEEVGDERVRRGKGESEISWKRIFYITNLLKNFLSPRFRPGWSWS